MAAKVETLRTSTLNGWSSRGFVTVVAGAARRWMQRGQLGQSGQLGSSSAEMRVYTGAR